MGSVPVKRIVENRSVDGEVMTESQCSAFVWLTV